MIKIKDSGGWLIFIGICFCLAMLALFLVFDTEKMEQVSLQDRVETLEKIMEVQDIEMKSRTRPIINIKYGTVYHAEGEIVVEEDRHKDTKAPRKN